MQNNTNNLPELLPRKTVAIAGLGLLGGSLGLALRRALPDIRVLGCARRPESIRQALQMNAVHDGDTTPETILPQADLTVVCMPVSATIGFVEKHAADWSAGSGVTDVGSTKSTIVEACTQALAENGVAFVGSHPMAGKESAGLDHADTMLYQDATVFLCAESSLDETIGEAVKRLWEAAGAQTAAIDPHTHDALAARTSHVLHLLAAAAVRQLPDDPNAVRATAGAFRDVTRIAASSPDMWTDICRQNRSEVLKGMDELIGTLVRYAHCIRQQDWNSLTYELQVARRCRLKWEKAKTGGGGDDE